MRAETSETEEKEMKRKPTVGERLFTLNVGNAARNCPKVLTPVIVSKVGRKYFATQSDDGWKVEREFHIEDWREKTDYSPYAVIYESEKQYADEKQSNEICGRIGNAFQYGKNCRNLPLETLRKIEVLMEETK